MSKMESPAGPENDAARLAQLEEILKKDPEGWDLYQKLANAHDVTLPRKIDAILDLMAKL